MIRLGKLTDYGLVLMTHIAQNHDRLLHTARDLAVESRLPLPTVSKLLKELLQGGLLVSHRGIKGGYSLARKPREIPALAASCSWVNPRRSRHSFTRIATRSTGAIVTPT